MNIHLPAILGFTRYQGFDPSPVDPLQCHEFCRSLSRQAGWPKRSPRWRQTLSVQRVRRHFTFCNEEQEAKKKKKHCIVHDACFCEMMWPSWFPEFYMFNIWHSNDEMYPSWNTGSSTLSLTSAEFQGPAPINKWPSATAVESFWPSFALHSAIQSRMTCSMGKQMKKCSESWRYLQLPSSAQVVGLQTKRWRQGFHIQRPRWISGEKTWKNWVQHGATAPWGPHLYNTFGSLRLAWSSWRRSMVDPNR